jgi:hypothetical protein
LGPKQRLAVHNEICRMLRDIEGIRLVAHSARGRGRRPRCGGTMAAGHRARPLAY